MKNKIIIFISAFMFSIDFVILLLTLIFSFVVKLDSTILTKLYSYISSDNNTLTLQIIILVHVAAFAWLANINTKIILPNDKFNKVLINFPEYQNLKITAFVAICEPVISIIVLLYMVIWGINISNSNKAILVIGLFLYTSYSVITTFIAEGKIKELLYRNEPYKT